MSKDADVSLRIAALGALRMAYCKACGVLLGRFGRIRPEAALIAQSAGYKVNVEEFGISPSPHAD